VKIEDLYYFSSPAYDGVNALGELTISVGQVNCEGQGINPCKTLTPKLTQRILLIMFIDQKVKPEKIT